MFIGDLGPEKGRPGRVAHRQRELAGKVVSRALEGSEIYPEFGQRRISFFQLAEAERLRFFAVSLPLAREDERIDVWNRESALQPEAAVYPLDFQMDTKQWREVPTMRLSLLSSAGTLGLRDEWRLKEILRAQEVSWKTLRRENLAAAVILRSQLWKPLRQRR